MHLELHNVRQVELLNDFLLVSNSVIKIQNQTKQNKKLFSWLIFPRCDKNKVAWKLGFKLWWTSPPRLITRLAVMPHDRKWAWHWPVYIFYVCLWLKWPYQYIQSDKAFQKALWERFCLLLPWKPALIISPAPTFGKLQKPVRTYPITTTAVWKLIIESAWKSMMKRGGFLFLMRPGYKHEPVRGGVATSVCWKLHYLWDMRVTLGKAQRGYKSKWRLHSKLSYWPGLLWEHVSFSWQDWMLNMHFLKIKFHM